MREREEELNDEAEAKRAELIEAEQILMERYGHRIDEDGTEENADENDESDSVGGAESSGPTKKSIVCSVRYKRSRRRRTPCIAEYLSLAIAEKDKVLRQMKGATA